MPIKPNLAGPWVDVRSFAPSDKPRTGNPNDPDTDWYQPIQAAIDYLVNEPYNTDTGTLYLPPGWYRISRPLQVRGGIYLHVPGDVTQGYDRIRCSIHIVGDAPGYGVGTFHGTGIATDFADGPALIIQSARSVQIENIVFRGKNGWTLHVDANNQIDRDPGDMATHYDDANYLLSGVRNNRYSPHAGIHIDPYDPAVAPADQYPALTSEYSAPDGHIIRESGSSAIRIYSCEFRDFAVGIGISLNGYTANAENITIVDCTIVSTRSAIAVGQTQSRNVTCRNLAVSGTRVAFDCVGYGAGSGNCPSIFGANLGGLKYLFQTFPWGGQVTVSGLYSEALYSIGNFGSGGSADPHVLSGCVFNFASTPANKPVLDLRLSSASLAVFTGCTFNISADEPMYIYSERTMFNHCVFGVHVYDGAPSFWNVGYPELTTYVDCYMAMGPDGARLSGTVPVTAKNGMTNVPMLPGTLFYGTYDMIDATDSDHALRWVSGEYPRVSIGSVAVFIDSNGTATFPVAPSFAGLVAVGDFIRLDKTYKVLPPPSDGVPVSLPLGKVTAVNASRVTLSHVPKAVVDDYISKGTNPYTLNAEYLPRIHNKVAGAVDLNVSVTDITLPSAAYASQWQPYNRIRDRQGKITKGTYVASVSGAVLTLSRPLPAGTPSSLDIYDADVRGLNTTQVI